VPLFAAIEYETHAAPQTMRLVSRNSASDSVIVLQAISAHADALALLQAALLDVLGGILPVADTTDVTWIQGCHPFGPRPRVARGRALSTLLVAQARRNAVLVRAASARAVAQSVAKIVEAAYTV